MSTYKSKYDHSEHISEEFSEFDDDYDVVQFMSNPKNHILTPYELQQFQTLKKYNVLHLFIDPHIEQLCSLLQNYTLRESNPCLF